MRSDAMLVKGPNQTPWIIGLFPATVLEIAAERGYAPELLLTKANIETPVNQVRFLGISLDDYLNLGFTAKAELQDPGLAVELGWRLPPTALGSFGSALLACSTLIEALEVLQRFWHLVSHGNLVIDRTGEVGSLHLEMHLPLPEDARRAMFEICFAALYRSMLVMAPQLVSKAEIWFDFPEPEYGDMVRRRFRESVRYGMPAAQFRLPTVYADEPLPFASPAALAAAVEQCVREEREQGLSQDSIVARVEAAFRPSFFPALEEMAKHLGMTARTLRRHLTAEGVRYAGLLERARRREAIRLLDQSGVQTNEIADVLGYTDPANFTRAFRRWTGRTPRQYRAQRFESG